MTFILLNILKMALDEWLQGRWEQWSLWPLGKLQLILDWLSGKERDDLLSLLMMDKEKREQEEQEQKEKEAFLKSFPQPEEFVKSWVKFDSQCFCPEIAEQLHAVRDMMVENWDLTYATHPEWWIITTFNWFEWVKNPMFYDATKILESSILRDGYYYEDFIGLVGSPNAINIDWLQNREDYTFSWQTHPYLVTWEWIVWDIDVRRCGALAKAIKEQENKYWLKMHDVDDLKHLLDEIDKKYSLYDRISSVVSEWKMESYVTRYDRIPFTFKDHLLLNFFLLCTWLRWRYWLDSYDEKEWNRWRLCLDDWEMIEKIEDNYYGKQWAWILL